ncbi:MAG: DeoR/GlpR family DNA-binding transcription regulator [Treponema sp.]|nr:DeoR/GlpR family DNA-binding transcription regulator [Treponema sp.]
MNAAQRRMEIYQLLEELSSVEVNNLAERFNVSTMTIRRDLQLFESQGLVTTNYGGAYLNRGAGVEPGFALKQGIMAAAKHNIAEAAAALIKDGNTIIVDCGTSTAEIFKCIKNNNITIVTGAWSAVGYLHGNRKIKLILAPGEYDELSAGVVSTMTADFYRNFNADFVFISTQGLDPDYGATVPSSRDAIVKRALLEAGETTVLLADSSKVGKRFFARHAATEEFDIIITDDGIPKKQAREIKKRCPKLVIVPCVTL